MESNLDKTEIIVFRNGGPLQANEICFLGNERVRIKSCYKYMGLHFKPKLSWFSTQQKLASKVKKTTFSIYRYQRYVGYFTCKDIFK